MSSFKELFDTLETWIEIGIADDIVATPDQRPEYQKWVQEAKAKGIHREEIPEYVLKCIKPLIGSKVDTPKVESKPAKKAGKQPGSPKTGGRVKGTPNKRSAAFGAVLDANGFSIPEKAMELFNSTQDEHLKFKLLEFLATYSRPKIKDQEFQPESDVEESEKSDAELLSIIK